MKKKWNRDEIELPEINDNELQFIMVVWDDCNEPGDETHEMGYFDNPVNRHAPHISVGIVLKDDEHGVTLCRDVQLHDELTQKELCIVKEYIILKKYLE